MPARRTETDAAQPRRRAGPFASFCLVLAVLVTAFFSDSLLRGRLLSPADLLLTSPLFTPRDRYEPNHRLMTDVVYSFEPWAKTGFEALRRGRIPWLDPDIYCGAPHYGNLQTARLNPLRQVPVAVSPRWHAFFHALELLLAGVGMYLLAAALGLGEPSRWLGGLAWAFSGGLVVWKLWPLSTVIAASPWILLGLVLVLGGSRWGFALAALSVAAAWLAGHPQTAAQLLLVVGLFGIYRAASGTGSRRRRWARLGLWALAVALGTGLVAVFLLPGLHYVLHSHAWQLRVARPETAWHLGPPSFFSLPGFFLPYVWGSRIRGDLPLNEIVGAYNTNELAGGYVSILVPLVFLPIAWRRRSALPDFRFWALSFVLCLVLAARLPPVSSLFAALPVLGATNAARMIFFAGLSSLLLSMGALEALRRHPLTPRERRSLALAVALLGLAAVSVSGTARLLRPQVRGEIETRLPRWSGRLADNPVLQGATADELTLRLERTTVHYPLWIGTVALLAAAALAVRSSRRPLHAAPLIVLTVVDLFAFGRGYSPAIDASQHFPEAPAIRFLRLHAGPYRVAAAGRLLPPNVLSYYGLADIRGVDALEPRHYMEAAIEAFGMQQANPPNFKFYAHRDYTHPLADFLGMKYLLTDSPLPEAEASGAAGGRFRLVFQDRSAVFVYENTEVRPGYFLARSVEVEPSPAARLKRIARWSPKAATAIVESGEPAAFEGGGRVVRTHQDDRSMRFAAQMTADGFLAVASAWLPGWSCEIDGTAAPVLRTLHGFLGVRVPAGSREIVFRYRPGWLRGGAAVSLAAAALLATWMAGTLWRTRRANG